MLAEARAEAARIAGEAAARLARQRAEALRAHAAERQAAAEVALAAERRAARRRVLEARQRYLDRVFGAVRAMLPAALATGAYRAALAGHLAEALAYVSDERAVIRCAPPLADDLRKLGSALAVEPDPEVGSGFRIVTADGAVEVDNTLDGRLERLERQLAREALARVGDVA